ncbi:hypothetical protein C6P44_002826 [Monosporozyma unispora]|nr:hypothetical protein C6P44_002826 [Kazachstania unispora]
MGTTLYYHHEFIRPVVPTTLSKYFKAGIKFIHIDDAPEEFEKEFPLKQSSDGSLSEGDEGSAITGWAITDGVVIVTLTGGKEFYGVPTTDSEYPSNYKVYTSSVSNSKFFYIIGTTGDNNQHYTFVPAGVSKVADSTIPISTGSVNPLADPNAPGSSITFIESAPSTVAPSTTSTVAPTTTSQAPSTNSTVAPTITSQAPTTASQTTQTTSTVAQVSSTSTSSQPTVSVQTENGAEKLGIGLAAGLAGVAAILS